MFVQSFSDFTYFLLYFYCFRSDNIDYIVDECCARMRASYSDTHTQQHTDNTHENTNTNYNNNDNNNKKENYNNINSNKNSKFNKYENFENRVFQCDENRPEHSHGILDFVFTKLGHEAFSPTTTSLSTSSSSFSVSRKNNSTPISILKGIPSLFLPLSFTLFCICLPYFVCAIRLFFVY